MNFDMLRGPPKCKMCGKPRPRYTRRADSIYVQEYCGGCRPVAMRHDSERWERQREEERRRHDREREWP